MPEYKLLILDERAVVKVFDTFAADCDHLAWAKDSLGSKLVFG